MLSKKLGVYQWLSLLILMTGVAFVQVTFQILLRQLPPPLLRQDKGLCCLEKRYAGCNCAEDM